MATAAAAATTAAAAAAAAAAARSSRWFGRRHLNQKWSNLFSAQFSKPEVDTMNKNFGGEIKILLFTIQTIAVILLALRVLGDLPSRSSLFARV